MSHGSSHLGKSPPAWEGNAHTQRTAAQDGPSRTTSASATSESARAVRQAYSNDTVGCLRCCCMPRSGASSGKPRASKAKHDTNGRTTVYDAGDEAGPDLEENERRMERKRQEIELIARQALEQVNSSHSPRQADDDNAPPPTGRSATHATAKATLTVQQPLSSDRPDPLPPRLPPPLAPRLIPMSNSNLPTEAPPTIPPILPSSLRSAASHKITPEIRKASDFDLSDPTSLSVFHHLNGRANHFDAFRYIFTEVLRAWSDASKAHFPHEGSVAWITRIFFEYELVRPKEGTESEHIGTTHSVASDRAMTEYEPYQSPSTYRYTIVDSSSGNPGRMTRPRFDSTDGVQPSNVRYPLTASKTAVLSYRKSTTGIPSTPRSASPAMKVLYPLPDTPRRDGVGNTNLDSLSTNSSQERQPYPPPKSPPIPNPLQDRYEFDGPEETYQMGQTEPIGVHPLRSESPAISLPNDADYGIDDADHFGVHQENQHPHGTLNLFDELDRDECEMSIPIQALNLIQRDSPRTTASMGSSGRHSSPKRLSTSRVPSAQPGLPLSPDQAGKTVQANGGAELEVATPVRKSIAQARRASVPPPASVIETVGRTSSNHGETGPTMYSFLAPYDHPTLCGPLATTLVQRSGARAVNLTDDILRTLSIEGPLRPRCSSVAPIALNALYRPSMNELVTPPSKLQSTRRDATVVLPNEIVDNSSIRGWSACGSTASDDSGYSGVSYLTSAMLTRGHLPPLPKPDVGSLLSQAASVTDSTRDGVLGPVIDARTSTAMQPYQPPVSDNAVPIEPSRALVPQIPPRSLLHTKLCELIYSYAYSLEILVAGGRDEDNELDTIEVLDIGTMSWRTLRSATLQYPRFGSAYAGIGNSLIMCGGLGSTSVEVFRKWPNPTGSLSRAVTSVGRCVTLPSLREERFGASAVYVPQYKAVYVFGGVNAELIRKSTAHTYGSCFLDTSEVYFLNAPRWIEGPTLPSPRFQASAVAIGSDVYLIGGETQSEVLDDVDVFNVETGAWRKLIPVSNPLKSRSSARASSNVSLTPGSLATLLNPQPHESSYREEPRMSPFTANTSVLQHQVSSYAPPTTTIFDPPNPSDPENSKLYSHDHLVSSVNYKENRPSSPYVRLPGPRSSAAVVTCGPLIIVLGGRDAYKRVTKSFYVLDTRTGLWHQMPDMLTRREHASAVMRDGNIYVVGGNDGYGPLKSGEVFRVETNEWTLLPSMASPRYGAQALFLEL